ncbi:nucleotide exchange factor GrpE [Halorussus gelatinilyticus]|uniref:Protein GrpE n=1 Tax=Halorussus gelatinilyticus TaxID=2937524 RepID=A0A8U0IG64_9EURY|nr:nucleotide exchange factor GrpE [Halorussus gelatinilyticus]UPV99211.1 nucleotide exchange factor GrpE [Halorussus gelatinilyticus]
MTDEEATEQVREDAEETEATQDADAEEGDERAETDHLGPDSTQLVAEVAAQDAELATDLEGHLAQLEADKRGAEERADDLESKLKRNRADFQNYKKRAKKRQEQMKDRATEDLVENLLDVRDNLKRAVEDDHENVESLKEGVEMTLKELDRVFDDENVEEIAPEPGTETDPQRHEVMMQVESDQPEGTVADVYQPGYEMGEKVLRAAQVTVSDGGNGE